MNKRGVSGRTLLAALLAVAVAGIGAAALFLKRAGAFAPPPTSDELVARMSGEWARVGDYSATLMLPGGGGGPGASCDEWVSRDGEAFIAAKHFLLNYEDVHHWKGATWQVFRPGAGTEVDVTCANLKSVPSAAWIMCGYPTVGDLVEAIRDSHDRSTVTLVPDGGGAWSFDCTPSLVNPQGPDAAWPAGEALLGMPWRVMLSRRTYLPARVMPVDTRSAGMLGIGVTSLRIGAPRPPGDWRGSQPGASRKVQRTSLRCDLARPASVASVLQRLATAEDAYRTSLFPKPPPLPKGVGVPYQ